MENICNVQYHEVSQLKFLFLEQCIKCPSQHFTVLLNTPQHKGSKSFLGQNFTYANNAMTCASEYHWCGTIILRHLKPGLRLLAVIIKKET